MSAHLLLKLGHPLESLRATLHNGPGWRIGLWTQGCRLRCTETCLNPHFLDTEGGYTYTTEEIENRLRQIVHLASEPVEGISILGGEPTEQAEALLPLLETVLDLGLSSMVYTGYTLKYLKKQNKPEVMAMLSLTDLLVDGPFISALYDDTLPWRGSSNQQIHCLSNRYTPILLEQAYANQGKGFSIQMKRGAISLSGLQERRGAATLEEMVIRNSKIKTSPSSVENG